MTNNATKYRKRQRRKRLYLFVLVVGVFLCVLTVKKISLDANCNKLVMQQQELEQKKENLLKEKKLIEQKAKYATTNKYIEDVAREKLGLTYKDEVIFKAENK
jgi:cell division protein FtsB